MDNPFGAGEEGSEEYEEEADVEPVMPREVDRPNGGARPKRSLKDRTAPHPPAALGSQLSVAMDTSDTGDDGMMEKMRDPEWRKKQSGRLEKEMDIQIQKTRAETAMQREETYENLSQSKDRSQTSAVIVIFILEVAILKDLFLNNPQQSTFFYFLLALIIFAMCLAATIGFLLVCMNNVRSKIRKMDPQHTDTQVAYGTFKLPRGTSLTSTRKVKDGENRSLIKEEDVDEDGGGCLGWWRRLTASCRSQEETLEERLLRMYKSCYLSELQLTLNFAHTQSHAVSSEELVWDAEGNNHPISIQENLMQNIKGNLDRDLVMAAETGTFFEDATFAFPSEMLEDDESLTDAKLKDMLDKWHHLKSLRKQGSLLLQRVMEIRRRKLYSGLLRMQNIISHMLFTLIITSILIVGFGFTLSYYPSL